MPTYQFEFDAGGSTSKSVAAQTQQLIDEITFASQAQGGTVVVEITVDVPPGGSGDIMLFRPLTAAGGNVETPNKAIVRSVDMNGLTTVVKQIHEIPAGTTKFGAEFDNQAGTKAMTVSGYIATIE